MAAQRLTGAIEKEMMANSEKDDCKDCDKETKCHNRGNSPGCGYKHFQRIKDPGNGVISYLKEEYFKCCENRTGPGGRIPLDKPVRNLLMEGVKARQIIKDFPDLTECKKHLTDNIQIVDKRYEYKVKYDGAFYFGEEEKYIFYEVKGYGVESNSVLSAIMAAQFVWSGTHFKDRSRYYYLGLGWSKSSGPSGEGLTRKDYDSNSMIAPYIHWAEKSGYIKFFGVGDITAMLIDIKKYCLQL